MTSSTRSQTHFEEYFGPVERSLRALDSHGQNLPFDVAKFSRGVADDDVAISTLNLGLQPLKSWVDGRSIRMELFMLPARSDVAQLAPILERIAVAHYEDRRALLRGEIIGPGRPLVRRATVSAWLVTAPAYMPDSFDTFKSSDGQDVVIAWLVPITAGEADFAGRYGGAALENQLVEQNPVVAALCRTQLNLTS